MLTANFVVPWQRLFKYRKSYIFLSHAGGEAGGCTKRRALIPETGGSGGLALAYSSHFTIAELHTTPTGALVPTLELSSLQLSLFCTFYL